MRKPGLIVVLVVSVALAVGAAELDDEAKQFETMAALCAIGAAIEEYSIDNDRYPKAASLTALEPHVVPLYTHELARVDGWGNMFSIDSNPTRYTIASCGKGATGGCTPAMMRGMAEFSDPRYDIIFANGRFATWPKGSFGPKACAVLGQAR